MLIAGGWSTTPGQQTFLFVTPELLEPTGGSETKPNQVLLTSLFVEMPEGTLERLGLLGPFTAEGRESSVAATLPAAAADALMGLLERETGISVISSPRVTTLEGRQARITVGEPGSPDRTETLLSVDFIPTLTGAPGELELVLIGQMAPSAPGALHRARSAP